MSKTKRFVEFPLYDELLKFITKEKPEISELPKDEIIFKYNQTILQAKKCRSYSSQIE